MSLLPVHEALARIIAALPPPQGEAVRLADAHGRVLSRPLIARHDQPPFPASAMDGYAVRANDVVPGQPLRLIGVSQAGVGFAGTVEAGTCLRIFTGAPIPAGADAVIMQEDAALEGERVRFMSTPTIGRNIRPAGHDFTRGRELLPVGARLTPAMLAIAAAANAPMLQVARRPRIGVLATGDELVLPGEARGADQIVASNSYGLLPMLALDAEVEDFGIARDDHSALREALERVFASGIDILVTTGGASVGDHDIVQEVLLGLGVEIDFWRIAMRPGKPLMFGRRGKTLVFGLPGNPVSALVTATIFLLPALRGWVGAPEPLPLMLPLAGPTPVNTARRHFMRGQLCIAHGRSAVMPIAETDSGHLSSLALADVLIVQQENDPGRLVGDIVETIRLGWI